MNKITKIFIEKATQNLARGSIRADDYRTFLENISNGKCPICLKELEIIGVTKSESSADYKFKCGHRHIDIKLSEIITIRETKLKEKMYDINYPKKRKPIYESLRMEDIRINDNKVVDKFMVIDRKNNKYKEIITDHETGQIIHECEEPLTNHRGHGSAKKKI